MDAHAQQDSPTSALPQALDLLEPLDLSIVEQQEWSEIKRSAERIAPRSDIDGW